MLSNNLAISF